MKTQRIFKIGKIKGDNKFIDNGLIGQLKIHLLLNPQTQLS